MKKILRIIPALLLTGVYILPSIGILPPGPQPKPSGEKRAWRVDAQTDETVGKSNFHVLPGSDGQALLTVIPTQQAQSVTLVLERRRREKTTFEEIKSGQAGLIEVTTQQEDWGPWQQLYQTVVPMQSGRSSVEVPKEIVGTKYLEGLQQAVAAPVLIHLHAGSGGDGGVIHRHSFPAPQRTAANWEYEYRIRAFVGTPSDATQVNAQDVMTAQVVYTGDVAYYGRPMPMAMGADMAMAEAAPAMAMRAGPSMTLTPGHDVALDVYNNFMQRMIPIDFDERDSFMIEVHRYGGLVLTVHNHAVDQEKTLPPVEEIISLHGGVQPPTPPSLEPPTQPMRIPVRMILERQDNPRGGWQVAHESIIEGPLPEYPQSGFEKNWPAWMPQQQAMELERSDQKIRLSGVVSPAWRAYRLRAERKKDDGTYEPVPYDELLSISLVHTRQPQTYRDTFRTFIRTQVPVDFDSAQQGAKVRQVGG